MSVGIPTIVFPSPGPVLPPSPESTIEPMPSVDDPRFQNAYEDVRDMHWYLYSALQNEGTYPKPYYEPPYYTGMHMGDILEPILGDFRNESEWVLGWDMWCLMCPYAGDGEEIERNTLTKFPFCGEGTLSMEPLVSSAARREWHSEDKWELIIPNSTVLGVDDIMACAVELILNPEKVQEVTGTVEAPRQISQPFMVSPSFRGDESYYPQIRRRYAMDHLSGIDDTEFPEEEKPFSYPISSSSSAYYYPTSSRYWGYGSSSSSIAVSMPTSGSSFDDGDDDDPALNSGAQAAMGVCITVMGVAIICLCLMCNRKSQARMAIVSRTTDRLPTRENRRQGATAERQYVARLYPEAATATHRGIGPTESRQAAPEREPSTSARASATAEEGSGEVPPAYHEVVTNRERMVIEQRMHREGSAPRGWPPTYSDAQHAAATQSPATTSSTSISRPRPATTTSPRRSVPYPSLPSSPRS